MRYRRIIATIAIIALLVALVCFFWLRPSLPVPQDIDTVVLYSIDGRGIDPPRPRQPLFRGFPILGEMTLSDSEQSTVLRSINRGMAQFGIGGMACHWPRHGLRIHGTAKTIDYTICFECENIEVFDADTRNRVYTSSSAQPVLNDLLLRANIELCPGMIDVP